MSERTSCFQQAEREIVRGLLEGPEHDFFAGLGKHIVCADQGDVWTAIDEAIASLGICITVKVTGGPVGGPGNCMEWNASILVGEMVATHRVDNWDGKAADVVADAVVRAFACGGAFRPKQVSSDADENGNPIVEITGTCWVCTPGPEGGIPPPPPEEDGEGPSAEALEVLQ